MKKSGIIAAEVPFNYLQEHSNGRNKEIRHLLPLKCPSTASRGTQTAEIKKSGIIAAEVPFNYLQGH